MTAALLATVSLTRVPFEVVLGVGLVLSAMLTTWFMFPSSLTPDYQYTRIVMRGVFALLRGLSSPKDLY